MKCNICGYEGMVYKDTIEIVPGKVIDVYVCPKCGFHKRVE